MRSIENLMRTGPGTVRDVELAEAGNICTVNSNQFSYSALLSLACRSTVSVTSISYFLRSDGPLD